MKNTRILMLLLSLALVFCTLLTLVGCGGTLTECTEHKDANGDGICDTEGCGATVEKPDTTTDAFNENGELYLFKGGVPTFQFVVGADAMANQMTAVEDLAAILSGLSNKGTEIKAFAEGKGTVEIVEILVGTVTDRGDEYKINKYDYGNTGYVVKQIGTKIVVTGGSDKAITNALAHLKNNVFGIKKSNDNFTDFVMSADKTYDVKQSNYSLKEITVAGNSIKNYVITYPANDKPAEKNATNLQTNLYDKCGIRLEVMTEARADGKLKVAFRTIANTGKDDGFYVRVDSDKNLNIECEYATMNVDITTKYFNNNVFNKKNTLDFAKDLNYSENHRNIYYKDYAVGDGKTDDFAKIKEVHDLANENLLNVHADPNQTYYIGAANGSKSIIVKTNTYFHGCKFIFDDEAVAYTSSGRATPIFKIASDSTKVNYATGETPITSLKKGATNIGWEPGRPSLITLYNANVRHYIRFGTNADNGKAQHELILVDAKGNIDPSTPLQWNYDTITSMELCFIDDAPIEIRGEGDNGEKATVTTYHNDGPNSYWWYSRNFEVKRSNVTISGLKHAYENYVLYANGGKGAPYSGFIEIQYCNNVVVENMTYQSAPRYLDDEPDRANRPSSMPSATNGTMGTYEISAELANNIIWRDSDQSNFFNADGTSNVNGLMGTNFCKNLTFDNMKVSSFDAHCGVYNGTIRNSTLEHINFIGDGVIKYEDVVLYADGQQRSALNLRDDYGSTWAGDLIIDGLHIKIKQITPDKLNAFNNQGKLRLINAKHHNHFFGYTTYLPQNISIKNLLIEEYDIDMSSGKREEVHLAYNNYELKLFATDINDVKANLYRDTTLGGKDNANPMVPTKKLEYFTEYTGKYAELGITTPLDLRLPSKEYEFGGIKKSTMFAETEYWIDGVLKNS